MTQLYTNQSGIPLALAVWLASDYYDYSEAGLSVTTLLKPIRQTVLARRIVPGTELTDIETMINNRMGAAIHDSIEKGWTTNKKAAMLSLGFAEPLIERVLVNPTKEQLAAHPNPIPVYMEQRARRQVQGLWVSGKYDFVGDGMVEDFKSTSTMSFTKGSKDQDYILQGSMYRWLNPEIITKDTMRINFIFTDWSKMLARQSPDKYPQSRVMGKTFPLLSLEETDHWVNTQVGQLIALKDELEENLPLCTDEELWRSDPQFKYYKNPEDAHTPGKRSTKNFDTLAEANAFRAEKGVGYVKVVPGQVRACLYCPAFLSCKQKDRLIASGDLIV